MSMAEEVIAAALCPSWHRVGSAGMVTGPEGVISTFTTVLSPCAEHVGAARVALRALADAHLSLLYTGPIDDPCDYPRSLDYDEDEETGRG